MSIKELNDYLEENLEMVLLNENRQAVLEIIKGLTHGTNDPELKEEHENMRSTIAELKHYKDKDCYYAVDIISCLFGQGYVVVDSDDNYIEFIRTI